MSKIIEVATTAFRSIKPECKIVIDYDKAEDVLYINYKNSPIQKADFGRRFGDYVIRIKDGHVIGVTILEASKHCGKNFDDKPTILKEPMTIVTA
jgi:uncharacterized protein YuzE